MARILIDCSDIRFKAIPTGIPRVVANYIKWGEEWCHQHGYEMSLVVPNQYGVARAEPFLNWEQSTSPVQLTLAERLAVLAKRGATFVAGRLRASSFHAFMAVALLLPVRHVITERRANRFSEKAGRSLRFFTNFFARIQWMTLELPLKEGDIIFSPAYWHDVEPKVYERLAQRGCRIFFLVHDILPITHARYYSAPWRDEFKANVIASFSFVEKYFCVSGYTQNALERLAKGVDAPIRTMVTHNGFDGLSHGEGNKGSPAFSRVCELYSTFLITVGTIEPKKDHDYLLDQLSDFWDAGYDLPLLIIGRRGWLDQRIVDRIIDHPRLGEKLFWLTDMTDDDLMEAYRRARFLLFGSVAEGFGLPMIEALCNGLPVIAYDTLVSREVAGDVGLYFDKKRTHLNDVLLANIDPVVYSGLKTKVSAFRWPAWRERVHHLFDEMHRTVMAEQTTPRAAP